MIDYHKIQVQHKAAEAFIQQQLSFYIELLSHSSLQDNECHFKILGLRQFLTTL